MADKPPEALARVELIVNTQRMRRRILQLFHEGPARLLPRVRLVTELADDPLAIDLAPPASPLRIRLELAQLISQLLDQEPDLAPRAALFDLADSLALLVAELHDEAVLPETLLNLDVADRSGHWQRSLRFLEIATRFLDAQNAPATDAALRQRGVVEHLAETWRAAPPAHPIIMAGSTGSRGTTALLMHAIAALPQGAVVLPGFDFDLPTPVWDMLDRTHAAEDHPQYRFRRLMSALDLSPQDVRPWSGDVTPDVRERNKLVSLALRPAPVTSQWMSEGPALSGIGAATAGMSLLEAASPRNEAAAIALILRKAAQDGTTAALVTPDRTLTRRVHAALDRWGIEPDVSAGEPLGQTAPGRLFRHVCDAFGRRLAADELIILLKHPLVCAGTSARPEHLRRTRNLELEFRRNGPAFPNPDALRAWAARQDTDGGCAEWADWISGVLVGLDVTGTLPFATYFARHVELVKRLVAGPQGETSGPLWESAAGAEAERAIAEISEVAQYGGQVRASEYASLFRAILDRSESRDPVLPHPNIMIWGTLEARVQGAELVILGGLNDGVWPELPGPDPWLNREMRRKAGLLLPERRIGLAAHDFQQAIAARTVVLSRSLRDEDSETVPSRWLNRLTNLLQGISPETGDELAAMRQRGQYWVELAKALETPDRPVAPEPRPAPCPPTHARPDRLSVTAITRLIRDPYAIYARHILRISRLDPLKPGPSAPLRGSILHEVMEHFIKDFDDFSDLAAARRCLMDITDRILEEKAPWPAARILWRAKLDRISEKLLTDEAARQAIARPVAWECRGAMTLNDIGFTLTARADRIDALGSGGYAIYDYKTGSLPTEKEMKYFDKQLFLEAAMLERGGFENLAAGTVRQVAHIGLGAQPKVNTVTLEPGHTDTVTDELRRLLVAYHDPDQGYLARRAVAKLRFSGDYDHLARHGEWDDSDGAVSIRVGA